MPRDTPERIPLLSPLSRLTTSRVVTHTAHLNAPRRAMDVVAMLFSRLLPLYQVGQGSPLLGTACLRYSMNAFGALDSPCFKPLSRLGSITGVTAMFSLVAHGDSRIMSFLLFFPSWLVPLYSARLGMDCTYLEWTTPGRSRYLTVILHRETFMPPILQVPIDAPRLFHSLARNMSSWFNKGEPAFGSPSFNGSVINYVL